MQIAWQTEKNAHVGSSGGNCALLILEFSTTTFDTICIFSDEAYTESNLAPRA